MVRRLSIDKVLRSLQHLTPPLFNPFGNLYRGGHLARVLGGRKGFFLDPPAEHVDRHVVVAGDGLEAEERVVQGFWVHLTFTSISSWSLFILPGRYAWPTSRSTGSRP